MNTHFAGTKLSPLNRNEEYGTEYGAGALAARIRSYWARRGFYPKVWVEALMTSASPSANERRSFIVQSDMLNGRPQ